MSNNGETGGEHYLSDGLNPEVYSRFGPEEMSKFMFIFLLGYGRFGVGHDRGFVSSVLLQSIIDGKDVKVEGDPVVGSTVTKSANGRPLEVVFVVSRAGLEVDVPIVADLEGMPPPRDEVIALYRTFTEKVEPSARLRLWMLLREKIEVAETGTTALLPLIHLDSDTSVVSTVTLDYARLREPEWGDDLAGVREMLQILDAKDFNNRVGIFLGLLTIGDRRVTELLHEYRSMFGRYEIKEISMTESEFMHAPVIEFFVDWLHDLVGGIEDGRFGSVAGRLLRYATQTPADGVVMEQQVLFPSVLGRRNNVLIGEWSKQEFAERILPRLRELAEREPEPRVLPIVIEAWENV